MHREMATEISRKNTYIVLSPAKSENSVLDKVSHETYIAVRGLAQFLPVFRLAKLTFCNELGRNQYADQLWHET